MIAPFDIPLQDAAKLCPEFQFVARLAPSSHKAAFHVRDPAGNDLCLKIISPAAELARVQREIEALRNLDHPNIVRLLHYEFSVGATQNRHFSVEEFIEGADLTDHLKPGQPWSGAQALKFFRPLAAGLAALGAKSIVHRDLKPSNIRVRKNGDPVIVDFGVARLLNHTDLTATSAGARIGTLPYFAPEQFEGKKFDIDTRTDLFAFGIILHQALLGRHPFIRPSMTLAQYQDEVCRSTNFQTAPDFLQLPQRWRVTLQSLLEKQRVRRPRDANVVMRLLEVAGES